MGFVPKKNIPKTLTGKLIKKDWNQIIDMRLFLHNQIIWCQL